MHLLVAFLSRTVYPQSSTSDHPASPSSHLHEPYWLALRYWEPINADTIPYMNLFLGLTDFLLDCWPVKMGLTGCPETSVWN